ncbi:MAG TPA: hypothetical protein VM940_05530 [Chthoniobacterales bacterium]|jgi:hypothetical protein|nr:hypothetical protein [Chthoniobacterales bacterium]
MAPPTRGRIILAWIVVVLTVLAVWKFVDYRNRPPDAIPCVLWVI